MKPIVFVPKNWSWYKLYPRFTGREEGEPIAWCKCDMKPCDFNEANLPPDILSCLLCSCFTMNVIVASKC